MPKLSNYGVFSRIAGAFIDDYYTGIKAVLSKENEGLLPHRQRLILIFPAFSDMKFYSSRSRVQRFRGSKVVFVSPYAML